MFFGRSLKDTANKSLPSEDSGDEYQEPRPALQTASVSPLPNPKVRDGKSRTAPKGERSEGINHKFIERLIEELDRKNEAINKIGQDCLVLRRNAADQEKIIGKLRESLDESDLKTKRLIQSFDIDIIPHNELKRRYGLLAQKLETTLEKLDNAFKRIDQLERIEFEKEKVERENLALRQAHTAQQALVLDLQESVQKAQKFKSVIQKQETVIDKLEAELALQKQQNELVLPSGLAAANSVSSGLAPTASVSSIPRPSIVSSSAVLTPTSSYVSSLRSSVVSVQKEASLEAPVESPAAVDNELSQRLLRLHEENNVLRERLQQSEMNAAAASAAAASAEAKLASASKKEEVTVKHHVGSDQPVEMFKLLMRAEAAEIKTKALEQELIESAKVFGRQIRELKQRLK
ncbi:hypothetical protein HDU91_007216 [Kappamyces sp. JEL0680]|nr:hypothetical protein HDU91_007216 [Kappamyces sp. JEL0680]